MNNSQLSTKDFVRVLCKRKFEIILIIASSFAVVTLYSLLISPTYESNAKLLIRLGREDFYNPTVIGNNPVSQIFEENQDEQINSEIEILNSQLLIEQVIIRLGPLVLYPELAAGGNRKFFNLRSTDTETRNMAILVAKAVDKFRRNFTLEAIKKSGVIKLAFRYRNPDLAAKILNLLVELYFDQHLRIHQDPQFSGFFKQQVEIANNNLQKARSDLSAFRRTLPFFAPPEEMRPSFLKEEAHLQESLNEVLSHEAEIQGRLGALRTQLGSTPRSIELENEVQQNSALINDIQEQLLKYSLKEKEIAATHNDGSLLLSTTRKQLNLIKEQVKKQEGKQYSKSRSGLNSVYQNILNELVLGKVELEALSSKKKVVSFQLAQCKNKLKEVNDVQMQYNALKKHVDLSEQNYQLYLTKYEESRISNAMDAKRITNVSLIDPARPSLTPVRPRILLNIILSILFSSFGAIGFAFLREHLDDSLETAEDIKAALGLPVIASIPHID